MKYLIASIVLSIALFLAISGNDLTEKPRHNWIKCGESFTNISWDLARNGTELYNRNSTGKNYTVINVTSTFFEQREKSWGLKVLFYAGRCCLLVPQDGKKDPCVGEKFRVVGTYFNDTGKSKLRVKKFGKNDKNDNDDISCEDYDYEEDN